MRHRRRGYARGPERRPVGGFSPPAGRPVMRWSAGWWPASDRAPGAGFTLVELIVVVALAVILVTLAAPSFQGLIQNTRASSRANEFISAVSLARSEAVKRGTAVELCASADAASCSNVDSDWTTSWIVQEEDSGNPIRAWSDMASGMQLNEASNATSVTFNSRGELDSTTSFDFELWFDGCTGDKTRDISINAVGRTAVNRNDSQCD